MAQDLKARSAQVRTVRVYLKHTSDETFNPQPATCADDAEKHRKGCGASITFYRTYPGEKRMPFSGEAQPVPGTEAWVGNGLVAQVYTDNVHFADCPVYNRGRGATTTDGNDGKSAATGA